MKVSYETLELIKRYVKGEASEEERSRLNQMVENQPELQEEIELAKMLVGETERLERERLLDVISQAYNSEEEKDEAIIKEIKPSSNRRLWWALAGMILLLVGVFAWSKINSSSEVEKIYAFQQDTYITPSNDSFLRGSTSLNQLDNAYREYVLKNFDKSLESLVTISDRDSLYLQALYLKGHNYYQLQKFDEAIGAFDEILNKRNIETYYLPNFENVGWTQILAMLGQFNLNPTENKKVEMKKAVSGFIETSNPTDIYQQKAKELLLLLD